MQPEPAVVMLRVVPAKAIDAVRAGIFERAKRVGKSGRYVSVLNFASEYGLSCETEGRECDLVTPRSASRCETGCETIDDPPSLPFRHTNTCSRSPARVAISARAVMPSGSPSGIGISIGVGR